MALIWSDLQLIHSFIYISYIYIHIYDLYISSIYIMYDTQCCLVLFQKSLSSTAWNASLHICLGKTFVMQYKYLVYCCSVFPSCLTCDMNLTAFTELPISFAQYCIYLCTSSLFMQITFVKSSWWPDITYLPVPHAHMLHIMHMLLMLH